MWPGTSAAITINGARFDDALSVPRAAVFDVGGTPTVYVRSAAGFDPRPVKVRAWTETVAVVEDIDPAALVTLVDPTRSSSRSTIPGSSAPTPGVAP